jgi:hypothetical protein
VLIAQALTIIVLYLDGCETQSRTIGGADQTRTAVSQHLKLDGTILAISRIASCVLAGVYIGQQLFTDRVNDSDKAVHHHLYAYGK